MTVQNGIAVRPQGHGFMRLSPDGYVRLTLEQFQAIPLVHLLSSLDPDECPPFTKGPARPTFPVIPNGSARRRPSSPWGGTGGWKGRQDRPVISGRAYHAAMSCWWMTCDRTWVPPTRPNCWKRPSTRRPGRPWFMPISWIDTLDKLSRLTARQNRRGW